ncbi:DsrH/TusB family sulfur relay protein [Pseudoalteromonas sp. SSDWG2]|uniref:DsrH/TusB family sulfur relay protein n=1 Tax=Pseudoalteromonas sp. SSDWG2 TaxID=3139391 RepID=UPI003BA9FDAB
MNTLFIISRPVTHSTDLHNKLGNDDALLLRADACYNADAFCKFNVPIYALEEDVIGRGAQPRASKVQLISDEKWVELTLTYTRCVSE